MDESTIAAIEQRAAECGACGGDGIMKTCCGAGQEGGCRECPKPEPCFYCGQTGKTDDNQDTLTLVAALRESNRQRDEAYTERNKCVALIAKMAIAMGGVAGLGQHDPGDASWDPEWRTIVYVDLPTGQASWHIHDSERELFDSLPSYDGAWDGHTTAEKYDRLRRAFLATVPK